MSNFKFSSSFFQVKKMQPLKKLMRFSCQQLILRQIPSKLTCTGISQSSTLQHTFIHNYSTIKCPCKLTSAVHSNLSSIQDPRKNFNHYFHEDRETKDVTVWGSIKHLRHSPMPALVLGVSGLIPFIAAPAYMMYSSVYMGNICFAQMTYGATILSFLGGVRWGYSVAEESILRPDWINLGVSVIPSLVAWIGLLIPHPGSLFTVMCGLAGAGYYDMATYGYPPWFKGLRFILTFVAILSLWTTFMCSFLLKKDNSETPSSEG
jgi:hypothetical protein